MKLKHKAEWNTIEDTRKDKERLEDRELQQLFIKSQLLKQDFESKPTPEPVLRVHRETDTPETVEKPEEFICGNCGKHYKYLKMFKKHVKTCK